MATKLPKNYDQAMKILIDLRDLAATSKTDDFARRIEVFRQTHARKPSLMERLEKLGMGRQV